MKIFAKFLGLFALGLIVLNSYELLLRAGHQALLADPRYLLLAFSMLVTYRLVNASGWGKLAVSLGGKVNTLQGVKIWLQSESLRWIPGSVWGYLSRAYMGEKAGLSKTQASMSLSLELVLTLIAWFLTALVFTVLALTILSSTGQSGTLALWIDYFNFSGLIAGFSGSSFRSPLVLTLLLGLLVSALAVFARFVFKKLSSLFGAIDLPSLNIKSSLSVLALYFFLCILNGLCFYFVCRGLGMSALTPSLAIAANANAFLIGLLAPFAPGGLGVREGGLAALLAPLASLELALGAALVWRAIQVAVEITCLLPCYLNRSFLRESLSYNHDNRILNMGGLN